MAPQTVWSVFAGTVARFGRRVAIEVQRPDRVDRFTYQQLHDLAVAHGAWLATNGVQPGDRCAILAHNDAHWCAVYLGILRAGAIAVPLDTNYSAKQVATIVRDSGARLLFVSERLRPIAAEALNDGLVDAQIDIVDVHAYPGTGAPWRSRHRTRLTAPAVILYTSGTTSDPKGVVLTHANLLAERDAAFKVVTVTDQDALLGVLPLFHSLAQLANLLLPFAVGARVVYLETINSTDLVRALKERQITIFCCVPQFFYLIHQRVFQQVQKSGLVTRRDVQDAAGAQLPAAPHGPEPRPAVLRQGARRDGPQDAAARHRRIEVRSGDWPRPLLAGLHHPAGLRPDRNQRRAPASTRRTKRTSTRWAGRCRASRSRSCRPRPARRWRDRHSRPDRHGRATTTGPTPPRR